MRHHHTSKPGFLLSAVVLLLPGAVGANLAPIGLSEVGARWIDHEDLLFFEPEVGDHFAWALAAGDFDGDGAEDLATGIPYDDGPAGSGCTDCGIVVIRYGVAGRGLATGLADTVLYQGLSGSPSLPNAGELFGAALAAGDFDGDGYDDLAVSAPRDQAFSYWSPKGAVLVYFGGPSGIEPASEAELLRGGGLAWQERAGGGCGSDNSDFGHSLAVGNFDGDAYDDLAIGAPRDRVHTAPHVCGLRPGAAYVAHGSAQGLVPITGYTVSQLSEGMHGTAQDDERFGHAVAAGDFNADGFDDLAIGVSEEDDSGGVNILFGSAFGLIYASDVFWQQEAAGLVSEAGDRFGSALVTGDFDGDGHADLAVGNPSEDLGAAEQHVDAGQISVFYGSPALFDYARTDNLTQGNVYANPAYDQTGDRFGQALAAGDFDGDGHDDLAVGHPGEDVINANAGAVTVMMGAAGSGLVSRFRYLATGLSGLPGTTQGSQDVGAALAVGDFDGSGFADLVVGAPWYDAPGIANVGGQFVLYGALFADGFELGTTQRWSSNQP